MKYAAALVVTFAAGILTGVCGLIWWAQHRLLKGWEA